MNIIPCSLGKENGKLMLMDDYSLKRAWLGVVPIVNGCSALYTEDHRIKFLNLPGNLKLLVGTIKIWTQAYRVELAGIEHLTSVTEMKGSSSFYVGYNAGVYEGIMSTLNIPFLLVDRKNRLLVNAESETDNLVDMDISLSGKSSESLSLKTRALTLAIYAKQIAKSREAGQGSDQDFQGLVNAKRTETKSVVSA